MRVRWNGASPVDVDREIVSRLEREFASLNGVEVAAFEPRLRARDLDMASLRRWIRH